MVRFKNRYICFELLADPVADSSDAARAPLSAKSVSHLIRNCVKQNFGDSGAGHILVGMQVKHFSPRTSMGIVKVPRDHCKMVLAAMTLATTANKSPCAMRTRHVSGTIKKCQRAAIRIDRELIVAWHQRQRVPAGDSTLSQLLQDSASQISALEL